MLKYGTLGTGKTDGQGRGPRIRRRQPGLCGGAAPKPSASGRMLAEPIRFGNGKHEREA